MRRKRMLLLLCLLLCVCCAFSGFAASSPDLTKTGSIQFRILSDYDPVPGGDLWLMRVCDVTKDSNGQLRYAWVPALQHLKFRPEDAFDFEHAKYFGSDSKKEAKEYLEKEKSGGRRHRLYRLIDEKLKNDREQFLNQLKDRWKEDK